MIDSVNTRLSHTKITSKLGVLAVSSTTQYVLLAGVILLAIVMRFYKLGEWGFWIDEWHTLRHINQRWGDPFLPLSFRLIGLTINGLGLSDWTARLAPNILGIVALPLFYFPIRKLFGAAVGLLAVTLLALSPWHLYWSQNARFYTALILFYGLGAILFYLWLETDRVRYLVASLLLMGLAAMERMNTVLFGPAVVVYFLALLALPFGRPRGFHWRNMFFLGAPVLAFALYQILGTNLVRNMTQFILGRQHNPVRVFLSIIYDIGLPLFLLALLGGAYLIVRKNRAGLYILISALAPVLVLVAISPFTQTFSRYVFMTLPFWAILGAVAAKEIFVNTQKQARILALGIVLILFADPISQDVLYYTYQNGNREDFKGALTWVSERMQPGDLLVSTRPELAGYYLGIAAIDSNQIDLDGILASGDRAWFVMDSRTHISDELQSWLDASSQLMEVFDVHIPGKTMYMRVYLWDPVGYG